MRLREHNAKPRPTFHGKDDYYLGIELEVEAPDYDRRAKGLAISKAPRYCYAKEDSSLNCYGWELVTHPIARSTWLSAKAKASPVTRLFDLVSGLVSLGYTSHDGDRCGLHVHVSRSAFRGGLRTSHFYWFQKLVNGNLFFKLSQRSSGNLTFCQRRTMKPAEVRVGPRNASRYYAVNPTSQTVEVRLFRGNMREDRVRKAVESVVAAVEFSRTLTSRDWASDLDGDFCRWVSERKATYPNLYAYLRERGVLTNSEDHSVEEVSACA